VGDPYLTGPFCLALRRWRRSGALLSSFYHSDLIETVLRPWANAPGPLRQARQLLTLLADRLYYRCQRKYPLTVVPSRVMERHLKGRGVEQLVRMPLGFDPRFARTDVESLPAPRNTEYANNQRTVNLLFAAGLHKPKAADLVLAALPRLLQSSQVHVTVI